MAYVGRSPRYGFLEGQTATFNGSTTVVTLQRNVSSTDAIDVYIDNVHQEPDVAYTLSSGGNSITFTGTPDNGAVLYVRFHGITFDTTRAYKLVNSDEGSSLTLANNDTLTLSLDGTTALTATSSGITIPNLTVTGTTTSVNSTNLNIGDNKITLNSDVASNAAPSENAGITINRGSSADVDFIWNETNDEWYAANDLATGGIFRVKGGGTTPTLSGSTLAAFTRSAATNNASIAIIGNSGGFSSVHFGDENDEDVGQLNYSHTADTFALNKGLGVTGNIAVSGTVDGVDIAARDSVLTSTTTTANAALPKAGGTMTGALTTTGQTINNAGQSQSALSIGGGSTNAALTLRGSTGSAYAWQVSSNAHVASALEFTKSTAVGGTTFSTPSVVFDGSGNVGIGTSSPSSFYSLANNLVVGTGTGGNGLTIYSQSNSSGYIGFNDTVSNGMQGFIQYNHDGDYMAFAPNGAERLRLDSVGTLFLGTTSPTLHSAYTGIVLDNGSLINEISRGASKSLTLAQNLAIDSGNTWAYLATDEGSYYQQYNGNHYFGTTPSGTAGADATVTSRMTILNNGNVGIGATNADTPLTVQPSAQGIGTNSVQSWMYALTSGSEFDLKLKQVVSSGLVKYAFDLRNNGTSYANNLVLDRGNVGIGTVSPGEKLSVNGTVSGSSYRILSGSTISYSGSVGRNTKIKGPTGTDVGITLYGSANNFAMQLYGDGNNSYGFLNGDWAGWDLKKTVAASGGNLYMNNSTDYWLNANGTSKTYQHLVGGISNTAGGAVFKVGSSSNNGELSLNSVNAGSDIVSYNRSNGTYHPLNYYAGSHNTFIAGTNMWSVDSEGHIKTQHGNTGGYGQTSGSGGIAIVNDQGTVGCSIISVNNAGRGWSNMYLNKIYAAGQDTRFVQFTVNGSGACGYIRLAGATTMTYGTSSDYRLKENVVYDWDATTRLKQLKPARFNFILDGDDVVQDGFMAHEVSDIVPLAVQGTKDAMKEEDYEVTPAVYDSEGNETEAAVMGTRTAIDPQGIDHSMLVPLLVKTIQELEARLTALEA